MTLFFSGSALREEPMVDREKLLACKWLMAKGHANSCTYDEWEGQPVLCGKR